jgi:hypothetical protein
MTAVPQKLAICVTCHFDPTRLCYLDQISDHFAALADKVHVTFVTDAGTDEMKQLKDAVEGKRFKSAFFRPTGLGHPLLLTWSHFAVFKKLIENTSISHFLYLEDDILLTRDNVQYWMEAREQLRAYKLNPSFLRVEKKNNDTCWYATDTVRRLHFLELPRIPISDDLYFVSLPSPYQAMYLLDQELMKEHLSGPSSHPKFCPRWGICEKAAQGLTFANVPPGFHSRAVVPYLGRQRRIDDNCLIHHTPNTYANKPTAESFATVPLDDLIINDLP